MKITITGRHVGVTSAMKDYAHTKVEKLLKFFERVTTANVTMDIQHDDHQVEMILDVAGGVRLVGSANASDMYAACDLAEQKLAQQLRKHKERLTDHHRGERREQFDQTAPPPSSEPPAEREQTYEEVMEDYREGN